MSYRMTYQLYEGRILQFSCTTALGFHPAYAEVPSYVAMLDNRGGEFGGARTSLWLVYGSKLTKIMEMEVKVRVTTYIEVITFLEEVRKVVESKAGLPDSGTRSVFDTGAVRDGETGKGRFDLLSPIAMLRKAKHYEAGAKKYEDRNWEKGIPNHRYVDSALRHIFKYLDGDRSEDHLAAAGWNIDGLIHTNEKIKDGSLPATLNTLPFKPENL